MPITVDVILDTNILLRTPYDESSAPTRATSAWIELVRRGYLVGTTVSNLAEFANVATRTATANGLGLSVTQAQARIRLFEQQLVIYSESIASYERWKQLVSDHAVHGSLVHDARIAAVMLESGIRAILTYNAKDFARFPEIITLHPDHLLAGQKP